VKALVTELLRLQAAAQSAHSLARQVGDVELAAELEKMGRVSSNALVKIGRQQVQS
jgi:hypothetical protein